MKIPFRPSVCLAISSALFALAVPHTDGADNRVRAVRLPFAAQVVKAQRAADGTIHLVLDSDDGPQYVNSRDNGQTFSAPLAMVDSAARKPGLKYSTWDLAVGKEGRVHVAMGNNAWKLKLPQEEWGLYYASLAPSATAFSPVKNINRKPSEGFSLAADERGKVAACFLSGKLFAMTSRDNGESFSDYAQLNPAWNPCDCCTTSAAYGPDGRLALLYREETNNERDIFVALVDEQNEGKTSRRRISTTPWNVNACPMTYFAISPAGKGYVVAWPTKGQVYFARLDKDGAVLSPGEIKTPGTSGMRTGLLALGSSDGSTLVAWKNKDLLGWQLYGAQGQPQGEPGTASSPGNGAAGVVLPEGQFLLFL